MAQFKILDEFYNSKKWKDFRAVIISERGPVCELCGKTISDQLDCQLDHCPIELTPENVHDASVALNPENVLIHCNDCHNKHHRRFGYQNIHYVYLVYGPPLSGKTTLVKKNMHRGDIVVDMDALYSAVSLLPDYDKPNELLGNVIGVRNLLLDNIKTRYGKWHDAWIIGGYEEKIRREQLAKDLGAQLIFCNVSKEECLARLAADEARKFRIAEWSKYINRWFEYYTA